MPNRNRVQRPSKQAQPTLRERADSLRASLGDAARGSRAAPDPVLAAIEAHRAACDAVEVATRPADTMWVKARGGDTADAAMAPAVAALDAACGAENQAWNAIFAVRPTTQAGLTALIAYAGQQAPRHDGEGLITLEEIFARLGEAVSGLSAAPTAARESTRPASAAPQLEGVPADLGDACRWALSRDAYLKDAPETLTDEFDALDAPMHAVFTRAINEPSTDLRQIIAKAALALVDYEQHTARPGHKIDDGKRVVLTVLREIAALTVESHAAASVQQGGLNLVGMIDFAAASLNELWAIHKASRLVGEVANMASQECDPRAAPSSLAPSSAAARVLMSKLSDALNDVEYTVEREAEGRRTSHWRERQIRLALIATPIIESGEPDRIAAFVSDVAEHAALEAKDL